MALKAVPASVGAARVAAGEAALELDASQRVADDVRLCVSEAVTNVVRHAYSRTGGPVEVVVERDDDQLVVVVRDQGRGLHPARRRASVGGFGLEIIDKVADRHTIETGQNAGTKVRMVFSLPAADNQTDR